MDKLKLIVDTDIGSDIDDALCMAYLFEEDICSFKRGSVRIGIGDNWGRSYFTEDARGNVLVADGVSPEAFFRHYYEVINKAEG